MSVINALLNFLLVSIPEELFLTCITLISLERFDLLDIRMWKDNFKWLAIPVVPVSFVINFFKYIIIIDQKIVFIISVSLLYFLIIFIYKKTSYNFNNKIYKKALFKLIIYVAFFGILEEITYPILLGLINKPLDIVINDVFWNFLLSLPSRIIVYSILIYKITKDNNKIKIELFDIIIKNKLYYRTILFCTISFNILSVSLIKLIWIDGIFNNVSFLKRTIISESLFILPTLVILLMILLINNLIINEKQIQQTYENLIIQDDVTTDVEDQ